MPPDHHRPRRAFRIPGPCAASGLKLSEDPERGAREVGLSRKHLQGGNQRIATERRMKAAGIVRVQRLSRRERPAAGGKDRFGQYAVAGLKRGHARRL